MKNKIVCYNVDASGIEGRAENVVFPKTIDEVQRFVTNSKYDIVPRGGGSSIMGGCVPNNSIVVDMRKMNKILDFNLKKEMVYAEAGITIKELNEKLKSVGFEFPFYTNDISTIGGAAAKNSIGEMSMKYGKIKEMISEIHIVNGRGELMKIKKSDLNDVCGKEGITGIIVKIKLNVIPILERSSSIFQTEDIEEIWAITKRLKLEKDVVMLKLFNPFISDILSLPNKHNLIVFFNSNRGKIKGEEFKNILKIVRKDYYSLYSENYFHSIDAKFYFDKLKDFVDYINKLNLPYFIDLGMGIVYCFFKEKSKNKDIKKIVNKMNGRFGCYGIGIKRKDLLEPLEKKIFQRIKQRYDPFLKLNKGKVLDFECEKKSIDGIIGEINQDNRELKIKKSDNEKNIKKENFNKKEVGKVIINDNLDRIPADKLRSRVSESEKDLINSIMFGKYKEKQNKKEDKNVC